VQFPLSVVLVRTPLTERGASSGRLASTKEYRDPRLALKLYKGRTKIEERIDQSRNCWCGAALTTPELSMPMRSPRCFRPPGLYARRASTSRATHHEELATRRSSSSSRRAPGEGCRHCLRGKSTLASLTLMSLSKSFFDLKARPRERMRRWIKKFRKEKRSEPLIDHAVPLRRSVFTMLPHVAPRKVQLGKTFRAYHVGSMVNTERRSERHGLSRGSDLFSSELFIQRRISRGDVL